MLRLDSASKAVRSDGVDDDGNVVVVVEEEEEVEEATAEAVVAPEEADVDVVEEAVKECEFRDRDVFVFRDGKGKVKVLHRRKDGKIELIEVP